MVVRAATGPASAASAVSAAGAATPAVALPTTLTMDEARQALRQLAPALAAAGTPVLDASGLETLDTAALAVLLECQRQAVARGQRLQVTGAPDKLRQLARLYGVDAVLDFSAP